MAKESKATQQLTFADGMEGSTTWITKWGRFELAEDDHILLYPEPHYPDQVPYEGTITTTSDDVANVTINNVWGIPTGLYILEYVPDMMPAEWVQSALEFSHQPQHTPHASASGNNNKPVNRISDDIIRAVAAELCTVLWVRMSFGWVGFKAKKTPPSQMSLVQHELGEYVSAPGAPRKPHSYFSAKGAGALSVVRAQCNYLGVWPY